MPSSEPFPLFFPNDARRAFETDEATRRFAQVAGLANGSRVLDLSGRHGGAAVVLAREFGCEVTTAGFDDASVAQLNDRVRSFGLADKVDVKKVDPAKVGLPDGEFDAILIQGAVLRRATELVKDLRRLLAPKGRLGFTYPARVGRFPSKPAIDFWEGRLGEQLMLPRELLQLLQRSGFEPESVETLSDSDLAELYRQFDGKLDSAPAAKPLQDEIEHFKSQGKASVSYALAIGRRKEPGEKPPASRDRG
jgi:cyclopropane fatty-acyl-phospholipid synthase-like methyltransferase